MNKEFGPIEVIDVSPARCNKARRDMVHAERKQEQPLTNLDFRLTHLALEELGGVLKEDVRKKVKEIKNNYKNGGKEERANITNGLDALFLGLVAAPPSQFQLREEAKSS